MPYDRTDRMTAAELDAYCAERMKPENLPKWWTKSEEMMEATPKRVRKRRYGKIKVMRGRK